MLPPPARSAPVPIGGVAAHAAAQYDDAPYHDEHSGFRLPCLGLSVQVCLPGNWSSSFSSLWDQLLA